MQSIPGIVPVTLLTGYLGAGKTTLLNRILTESHGAKYAVIVNEFGEVGIDNDLIVDADEEVIEMNNGCICCNVRGDLIRILGGLMKRNQRFDGIIIETTGLADPAPVAQTFIVDDDIRRRTKLDAIVTIVDAFHMLDEFERAPEIREQVAFADVILINKCERVNEEQLVAVEARLQQINPYARTHRTQHCQVPLEAVIGVDAFDLERILDDEPHFLDHMHHHHHASDISSLSLVSERPMDPGRFLDWIHEVTRSFGPDLLRLKGIVSILDDEDRFVVQAVHMLLEGKHQRKWRPSERRETRVVMIGRNLPNDVLRQGFERCRAY